jgi:hypothetical protein
MTSTPPTTTTQALELALSASAITVVGYPDRVISSSLRPNAHGRGGADG